MANKQITESGKVVQEKPWQANEPPQARVSCSHGKYLVRLRQHYSTAVGMWYSPGVLTPSVEKSRDCHSHVGERGGEAKNGLSPFCRQVTREREGGGGRTCAQRPEVGTS